MTLLEEVAHVQATADLLYDGQQVNKAIDSMAKKINLLLEDRNPLFLCVMNGGMVVGSKLLTRLTMPLTVDAINASRYQNKTTGDQIEWLLQPATPLRDRTVLVVDDILDAGITLDTIVNWCLEQGATSVYTAVLVDKMTGAEKPIAADFVGLQVENRYLFGCGMDYKGYLRNLPGIYACKDDQG